MSAVRVAIAGSSGSIGVQTLDVIRAERGQYEVVALGVGSSIDVLIAQANEFRPKLVAVADRRGRAEVAAALPFAEVVADLADLADDADVVVNGVVGFAGLSVTVRTLQQGKRLALANKESLIAGAPGRATAAVDCRRRTGARRQRALRRASMPAASIDAGREVARIVLTASGGPFRGRTSAELADVGVEQALAHPTWKMGPKITIDSSTLMNKGLEVIEAHELFGTAYDQIEVVVHPQSVVHSMVEFTDGSTIAQLSMPDMRLPIGYALPTPTASRRRSVGSTGQTLRRLDFEPADTATFRCLPLAYEAGRIGSHRAGMAQRGQRGRRRRVPGRTDPLVADRRGV